MTGTTPLLGRDRELTATEQALRAALGGTPTALVVTGEAGIGKSTLARAVAARAAQLGLAVGFGLCLDVASLRPYGPVLEALNQLDAATAPGDAMDMVRALGDRVGRGPVLLVLEDLQWAGPGTRDVVRTLVHTMGGRLALLVTVRTEGVPRSHPAGDLVRDVTRSPFCTVVELGPLDEAALRLLATRRLGVDLDLDVITGLLRRSEGNPLYAEELLDARGADQGGLPPRLADLFLARVDQLPGLARTVLRAASVVGLRVEESLVAAAAQLPTGDVTSALKAARDRQLLVVRDGHLEFRHALLRDALDEDLLAAERAALHGRLARELEIRSQAREGRDVATLARLSFHAERAGDLPTALLAMVRAGRQWRSQGIGSGVEHLVRALDLWQHVPHPEDLTGTSHAELLLLAGRAAGAHGDVDQARALLRDAVDEAERGTDRLLVSRAYAAYAVNGTWADDPLSERALSAALEAAGPDLSAARADALIPQAFHDFLSGRPTETSRSAHEILAIGASSGDAALQVCGRALIGFAAIEQGYLSRGASEIREAVDQATRAQCFTDSLFFESQLAWQLALSGPSAPALEAAEAAVRRARELRLPGCETESLEQVAGIQVWRGELDEADDTYRQMCRLGLHTHRLGFTAYELLLARGDLEGAARVLRELADDELVDEPPPDFDGFLTAARTELHLARGDLASAADSAVRALVAHDASEDVLHRPLTASYGYLVLRAHAESHRPAPLEQRAARMLRECLSAPTQARAEWTCSIPAAHVLVAQACVSGLAGQARPDLWWRAVEILEETGYALWRLRIQPHLAEDLWASGDRGACRTVLHDTWHEAHRRGLGAVAEATAALARRRHVSLPEDPLSGVESRLTPREREVLALLEEGATNRQIAESLVISEKTVSVHVSNLLAKLGAAHRGEAVAIARRVRG